MAAIEIFKKNLLVDIEANNFQKWGTSDFGTFYRMREKHVDWIQSFTFSERDGRVGVLVSRSYFEIDSIIKFIIEGKRISNYYSLMAAESWEKGTISFSYDEKGAKEAASYLSEKVFGEFFPKFNESKSIENLFEEHQKSKHPYLIAGIGKGAYSIYRGLLLTRLFAPENYEILFQEATDHFNKIIKDYAKDLCKRGQLDRFDMHPIKSIVSKLGRLDMLLRLDQLEELKGVKEKLIKDFVEKIEAH